MITPLNTKGLEAAVDVLWPLQEWNGEKAVCEAATKATITAYLSTSPAHADDLGEPVAWRWRHTRGGFGGYWHVEDNRLTIEHMPDSHYEVVPLYPAPVVAELRARVEAAEKTIREAECAVYGKHERGFAMKPLIDPPSLADAITALADAMREERDAALAHAQTLLRTANEDLELMRGLDHTLASLTARAEAAESELASLKAKQGEATNGQ